MKATITDIEKRIVTPVNKTEGILNYDIDNSYPQRINTIINSSGTGTLCTSLFGKFLYGGGFVQEALAKTIVSPSKKMTANKLLFKTGKAVSKFNGFAIHVNYNALYKKSSLNYVPFQDIRFTTSTNEDYPDMIAVYDDWDKTKSSKIKKEEIDYINFYNPDPEVIQSEVDAAGGWENYKGQIYYWSVDGMEYPLAPSDSVLEDVQTDSHAKVFKFRNITTNFMASHILETGEFEDELEKEAFLDNINTFQGSDDASKILLLEKSTDESSFVLTKVDIQDIDKLYQFTEESVRDNIIRNYLIPSVLLLATPGKLGTADEIKDATAFYNGVTEDYRTVIEESFTELFNDSMFIVEPEFDIIEVVAKTVEPKDTNEGKKEIVALLGNNLLSEKQKKTILEVVYNYSTEESFKLIPTAITKTEGTDETVESVDEEAKARAGLRGSVGGSNSIVAIQEKVNTGIISEQQAVAVLELIFGLSEIQARRMVQKTDINVN